MAELANAIRAKHTPNKQALILIESDGKNANGETIVTKYDRHSWRRIMLEPYRISHQNDWAHEAIVLLNSMSQRDLALHVNDRGGCALQGRGPWLGMTALHWAVTTGFPSLVNALLKIPEININARDESGRTPLHLAFTGKSYNVKIVTALIEHGADFSVRDKQGRTPLHIVLLFYSNTEWLPIMIMDHITNFDYNKKCGRGETFLETAHVWDAPESIIKKIESLM